MKASVAHMPLEVSVDIQGELQVQTLQTYGIAHCADHYFKMDAKGNHLYPIKKQLQVAIAVLQELQKLHSKGVKHGDTGFDHFIFHEENNKAYAIDFDSSFTKKAWLVTGLGSEEEFDACLSDDNDKILQELQNMFGNPFCSESFGQQLLIPRNERVLNGLLLLEHKRNLAKVTDLTPYIMRLQQCFIGNLHLTKEEHQIIEGLKDFQGTKRKAKYMLN